MYTFKNTKDGFKFLFDDGIYGEFAVFGESEIDGVTQAKGRIIWKHDQYHNDKIIEQKGEIPNLRKNQLDFSVNEALTNLYVGLLRVLRGERLSGYRFIETYAFNNILSIIHLTEIEENVTPDLFNIERRLEKRYPYFSLKLSTMLSGYDHLDQSAEAILNYLQQIYPLNQRMKNEIEILIQKLRNKENNND